MIATALPVLLCLLLATGALWLRRRYAVITVRGESMSPTYRPGDRLLLRRNTAIRAGQCVVFAGRQSATTGRPGGWILKRVIAVPGDPVPREQVPALREVREQRVPPSQLVVMGDNAVHSTDSRHLGYIAADRVLGIVLRRL
ncbi:S26 family signal peptidase [Nonomuraea sp. NPDC049269]|uniref:S26 family signal peptidase n=1 Tax=Nonomuraea sp. NPDC049269 TaxID=3364349 RepID=UPI00371FB21D